MTLLVRSLTLVAVSLLPAIAIQATNELDTRQSRQQELRQDAQHNARLAAAELKQLIGGVRELLITLTFVPSIREGRLEECNAVLQELVRENESYLNIATADAEGRILCSAVPPAPNITAKGRPYFAAYERNEFVVGNYTKGQTLPVALIQIAHPIRDASGKATGVIWLALRLDQLQASMTRTLPESYSLTVFDSKGTVLIRTPNREKWVGQNAQEQLARIVSQLDGHSGEARGLDLNTRVFGYIPPEELWGLSVLLGIDKRTAFAPIEKATWRGVMLILLGVGLALLVSMLASRYVLQPPVRKLLDAAARWRKGDYSARNAFAGGATEFMQLGQAFDEMAEAVASREADLITARHAAEERAAAAERAERHKDLLMRELNHRIKNNLQLIASLLQVQGKAAGDQGIRAHFDVACQRVFAVARLHERLYQRDFTGRVDFAELLKLLAEDIAHSFSDGRVAIQLSAEPIQISLDQAVPLALAATELIGNAFKHGYKDGRSGTVEVKFSAYPGGRMQLTVADDGAGLTGDFDPQRSGRLGMRILTEMARQIGGALQAQRSEQGARFVITAPLAELERASA